MGNKEIKLIITIVLVLLMGCLVVAKIGGSSKNPMKETNKEDSSMIIVEKEGEAKAEIIEKEEASYEEWLAAAMMAAVTLYEEGYELEHIYYKSETALNNKLRSAGVYIIYTLDGEKKCIYSKPLQTERTEKGKIDLYTQDLGFSTFDIVDMKEVNFEDWKEIEQKSLSTLISQSMLVSLYEN